MPSTITRSVRFWFASFLASLAIYSGLETLILRAAASPSSGLVACGGRDNPCRLDPIIVAVPARDGAEFAEAPAQVGLLPGGAES